MRRFPAVLVLLTFVQGIAAAQSSDWSLTLGLRGSYTTTSKIFYDPDSPSPEIRSEHNVLDNIYGGGFEIRFQALSKPYFLALTVEYLSKLHEGNQIVALSRPPRSMPVQDGFRVLPVELGLNMFIPLGSDRVRLAMGGGVGAYFGKRILRIVDVDARQLKNAVGYGIHVESSFDYRLHDRLWLRAEMRFRDPEIVTESQYTATSTQYHGILVSFPRDPFKTKINVNGLTLGLGIVGGLF
jgi:hypothetical protein